MISAYGKADSHLGKTITLEFRRPLWHPEKTCDGGSQEVKNLFETSLSGL